MMRLAGLPVAALLILVLALGAAHAGGLCDQSRFGIAIDIGHTRTAPGAISARGVGEFHFNDRLARELWQGLVDHGFTRTFLINSDGKIRSLDRRALEANNAGAKLFVAVHHDSVQRRYLSSWIIDGVRRPYSDRYQGFSLFVSRLNGAPAQSERFARLLGQELRDRGFVPTLHHAEPIAGENRPLLDRDNGVYRFDGLAVLRQTRMPALLLEAGVIVHRAEEVRLGQPARRALIVDALVATVDQICAAGTADAPLGLAAQPALPR